MATNITLKANPGQPRPVKRVQESPEDVTIEINNAIRDNDQFVIFTDADSGKSFSVNPKLVAGIEEE